MSKNSKTKIRFSPKFEGGGVEEELKKIKSFFTPDNKGDLHRHPKISIILVNILSPT